MRDGVAIDVETANRSAFRWEVSGDGSWAFREGTWLDEYGRVHRTGLLRPTLRGIARAARPDHDAALALVIRDIELAAGNLIERAEVHRRHGPDPRPRPSAEELLERTWPQLSAADRGALWAMTDLLDVEAGTRIMVKDERGRDVLFLLDGVLHVAVGREGVYLAPGSVVGEIAALGDGVRSATVETVTDCLLLSANGGEITALPRAVLDQLNRKVIA